MEKKTPKHITLLTPLQKYQISEANSFIIALVVTVEVPQKKAVPVHVQHSNKTRRTYANTITIYFYKITMNWNNQRPTWRVKKKLLK